MNIPSIKSIVSAGAESAINAVANGASKIIEDFKASPDKVLDTNIELEKLKNEALKNANDYAIQMETQYTEQQKTVNETMQAEAKSEHWAVWLWRPAIGFTFCLLIMNNYVVMPYLKKSGLLPIEIPDNVFTAILVILGAASAGRGLMQWQKAKNEQ